MIDAPPHVTVDVGDTDEDLDFVALRDLADDLPEDALWALQQDPSIDLDSAMPLSDWLDRLRLCEWL